MGERCVVHVPANFLAVGSVDERGGERNVAVVENLVHDLLLGAALCDEGDVAGLCDHGQREGDSVARWFGRVATPRDGFGLFEQVLVGVTREQRAGVAVGPAAEQ